MACKPSALGEAIAVIENSGLNRDAAIDILANGAPGSPLLKGLSKRMIARDYTTNFAVHLMAKDLGYAVAEGARNKVDLRMGQAALEAYKAADAARPGRTGLVQCGRTVSEELIPRPPVALAILLPARAPGRAKPARQPPSRHGWALKPVTRHDLLMKTYPAIALFLLLGCACSSHTDHRFDTGSAVVVSTLSALQIDNLAKLGKVWGFLKYHHPAISTGHRNWDYDLLGVLPAVLDARSREDGNETLARWALEMGETPPPRSFASLSKTLIQLDPDVGWIESESMFGASLSRLLQTTYRTPPTRRPVRHFPASGNRQSKIPARTIL